MCKDGALHSPLLGPLSVLLCPLTEQNEPLPLYHFLKILFIYLFIAVLGLSFLCDGFLQLRQARATLHRGARASHYRGLSCCGAQAPDVQAQ